MAELFFIATTIFVAYVVYAVLGNSDTPAEPTSATPTTEVKVSDSDNEKPKLAEEKPAKPAPSTPAASSSDNLKNPKTGEIAKIPNSYAFAKRWIKDALVEEGLLEKVYKNTELDDAINAKIQSAIQQLKAIDKYKAG